MPTATTLTELALLCYLEPTMHHREAFYFYAYFYGTAPATPLLAFE